MALTDDNMNSGMGEATRAVLALVMATAGGSCFFSSCSAATAAGAWEASVAVLTVACIPG